MTEKKFNKTKVFILMSLILLSITYWTDVAKSMDLNSIDLSSIDKLVEKTLQKSGTIGASIVIVSNEETLYRSYGYADQKLGRKVDQNTLFELGSNSKAFTALGIFYLEKKGLLSLSDSVNKYIPWLKLKYKGKNGGVHIDSEVDITIENLLYHTSGIPFKTIGVIPTGDSDDMLEKTVRTLQNVELDFYPGTKHSYATINYDVLGLIIQEISGLSYEEFMRKNILVPLGLYDTYISLSKAQETERMSKGYKISFFTSKEYKAPVYRGNTPAGYFITSSSDIERWLKIQMGVIKVPELYQEIILCSHSGNTKVSSINDEYYAGGWYKHIRNYEINHGGSNPNFSSMAILRPEQRLGIYVLTNVNSNAPRYIASNILNLIEGKPVEKYKTDIYKNLDTVFSLLTIGSVILGILFFVLSIMAVREILQGKRNRIKLNGTKVAGILFALPLLIFFGFCAYYLPNILLFRLPWDAVNVWGSPFIAWGSLCGYLSGVIFMLYVLITFNFPKDKDKDYLALVPLSIINGLMSALIIFTINESFNRNLEYSKELLVYFIFSLLFFVYSMKLLQGKLIMITNEITYEKRMSMISRIMNSSFQAIEKIGGQRIYSGLINDTAVISQLPQIIVRFVSDTLTLIFCLSFLLSKSIYAFLASISIIILNGLISFITSKIARKYWEENRNIQDTFFGQIADLVEGFKELVLNKLRKQGFYLDIKNFARLSTDLNKIASIKVLNFTMYNALMYNIVFGVVVFVLPIFIDNINVNELRENLFLVFYMIGPFSMVVGTIPQITAIQVNLQRINNLLQELDEASDSSGISLGKISSPKNEDIRITLSNVEYTYMIEDQNGEETGEFVLGPFNLEFKTGEITFITGGNGSGKSTLAKLLTGLYAPDHGRISINGKIATLEDLNDCFVSIFSDFHLFKKLYGIDYINKRAELKKLLEKMRIQDKVDVNDLGELSTLNLSTGQLKRLAFVVSCLEDKSMMLFDEWAAEQDPEFRHYFYNELLPMLKRSGKGVVVITHDDRYFDIADRVIKLERGLLLEEIEKIYA